LGGAAGQQLGNIYGLGGPEAQQQAYQGLETTPGYEFAKNQAVDAAVRGANTAGMGASGNTLSGITNLVGNQIAPQQFQQYTQGLAGLSSQYSPLGLQALTTGAGGLANLAGGQANIFTGTGQNLANLLSGTGQNISGLYTGQAQNLANLSSQGGLAGANVYGQFGPAEANLYGQYGQNQNQLLQQLGLPYASTYGAQAAAETGGSANLWNLFGNIAKLGTNTIGGGALSGLGNLFRQPAGAG
jgi:hypothetical protein